MNGLAIIGTTLVGAAVGFVVGAWWGDRNDTSDFPMGILLGFPGALIGGLAGCVVGVVLFT